MAHPTRLFHLAIELENAFNEYKADLEEQSAEWLRFQYVGKNGDRKTDAQKVPMTYEGFKRFCRKNYGEVHHYFDNPNNLYDDFRDVCHAIKEEIRENQIIGGLLGFYNPSITQRLNGLVEKTENKTEIVEQRLFPEG